MSGLGTGLVHRPISGVGHDLVVLDIRRRTYAGLSRDETYFHLIQPAQVELVAEDGTVVRRVGQLTCTCAGGQFRGECYRTKQAAAWEAGNGLPDPAWLAEGFDAPAGAGEAVEASRG